MDVTLADARTYWIGSVVSTGITVPILSHLGYKYCYDKTYAQPTMRVFVPYLLGSLLFTMTFCLHNGYNLSQADRLYERDGNLSGLEDSVWCDITWLTVTSIFVQFTGIAFIAWAPLSLIRRAKTFQVLRVSKRLIASVTCAGLFVGGLVVLALWLMSGRTAFMRFSCFPRAAGRSGTIAGFIPILILVGLTCWFFRRAQVELKDVTRALQCTSLQKKAAALRRYGFLTILNSFAWIMPYALLRAVEHLGLISHMPVIAYTICAWAYQYHAVAIVFIIRLHASNLKKKKRRRARLGKDLQTAFAPNKEELPPEVDNLHDRGVSIHFLHWFIHEHRIDPQMSVGDVMRKVIIETTSEQSCSFVEHIKRLQDSEGRWAVGKPSYFVSHAWSDTFMKLVEQLTLFYRQTGKAVYFWIDIFAINQHQICDTELSLMHKVIEGSDAVLLTLSPWTAPLTLTRVWCLWEVLKALQKGTEIVPVMPSSEELHFLRTVQHHRDSVLQMLSTIEVQNAGATLEEDKNKIFQEIADTIGFDGMNELLKVNLHRYLQRVAVDRAVVGVSEHIHSPNKDDYMMGSISSRSSESV